MKVRQMRKRIFTFWEPKKNMPGYIRLCLKTWEKFLPDYEIVICDYSNLKDYLTPEEIRQFLYRKFPLQQQSDALRTILLKKYGGIWLDADTILTSPSFFQELTDTSCAMIGHETSIHLAFVYAQKGSEFIRKWSEIVRQKVEVYRRFQYLLFLKRLFKEKRRRLRKWDYLGNSIVNPLAQSATSGEFSLIDKYEIVAFPELISEDNNLTIQEKYKNFYFTKSHVSVDTILNKTKGIILLHNCNILS